MDNNILIIIPVILCCTLMNALVTIIAISFMKSKIDDLSSYIYFLKNKIESLERNDDTHYEKMIEEQTKLANHGSVINNAINGINKNTQNIINGIQQSFDRLDKAVEAGLKIKNQKDSNKPAPDAKALADIDKTILTYLRTFTNVNSYGGGITKISDVQNPTARVILDAYPQYDPEALVQRVQVQTYQFWTSGEFMKYTKK